MTPRVGIATAALAIALGAPAWAAKVYVPYAVNQEDRGAAQRTELLLTNGQPSLSQRVSYRLLTDGREAAGGAAKSVDLAGGKSLRLAAPVVSGGRGLLEVDAPAGVVVSARLIVTRPGADPVESAVPVLDARSAFVEGARISLQGLSRLEGVARTSLGMVNLGGKSASCQLTVADADGNEALRGGMEFTLEPRVLGFQENLFDLFGAETPAEAVASLSCNQKFWAYAVVSDEATGAAQFVQPAFESMVEQVSAEAGAVFTLPGTFLTSSPNNTNWRYNMKFPNTQTFRKAIVDFDVFVKSWDSANAGGWHCLFWLNKGAKWGDMMGYLNARGGTRNLTVFEVNLGDDARNATGPTVKPGNTYHVHYEYDLIGKKVWYKITKGTATVKTWSTGRSGSNFSSSSFFIEFGTQVADGPEARTYGWKFSNGRFEYVP